MPVHRYDVWRPLVPHFPLLEDPSPLIRLQAGIVVTYSPLLVISGLAYGALLCVALGPGVLPGILFVSTLACGLAPVCMRFGYLRLAGLLMTWAVVASLATATWVGGGLDILDGPWSLLTVALAASFFGWRTGLCMMAFWSATGVWVGSAMWMGYPWVSTMPAWANTGTQIIDTCIAPLTIGSMLVLWNVCLRSVVNDLTSGREQISAVLDAHPAGVFRVDGDDARAHNVAARDMARWLERLVPSEPVVVESERGERVLKLEVRPLAPNTDVWFVWDVTAETARQRHREAIHQQMVELSRRAGKAEVAAAILHNIGNLVNSARVSIEQARGVGADTDSRLMRLRRVVEDPGAFVERSAQLVEWFDCMLSETSAHRQRRDAELSRAQASLDDMSRIVVSQEAHAHARVVVQAFDVGRVVDATLLEMAPQLHEQGIELTVECRGDLAVASCRYSVQQVLNNLVHNAVDAVAGRSRPRVSVEVVGDVAGVEARVQDNGVGFDSRTRDRLFEHGYTTKAAADGFGLHTCGNLMTTLEGRLEAYSDGPGAGATFVVRLPRRPQEDAAA